MKLAVVGAGWAGIAAAVRGTQAGHRVSLFEMAPHLGGRARSVMADELALDNGQHILLGAYRRTLDLMRTVDIDLDQVLARLPLRLRYPDGRGLSLPGGTPALAFVRAVLAAEGWSWRDRLALLSHAGRWAMSGFRCEAQLTVSELCAGLPLPVRRLLIDPLCVAALNTPAAQASAAVLLRVLRDALFSGRGSADLLLPRRTLDHVLPQPAQRWLRSQGATLATGRRVAELHAVASTWQVDGQAFDAVVLACSALEAARLARGVAPGWAALASQLPYEPIVTVYLGSPGATLPWPMIALLDSADAPAQFAFDHGTLGGAPGLFAFVISGARPWVDRGTAVIAAAVLAQARAAFPPQTWPAGLNVVRVLIEKRATFRCTPGLARPPTRLAPGLVAAGDYVAGPYPATLDGAVQSGEAAVRALEPER